MIPTIMLHHAGPANNFGDTLLARTFADWIIEHGGRPVSDTVRWDLARETNTTVVQAGHPYDALIFCGGGYFGEPPSDLRKRVFWGNRMIFRHLRAAFEAHRRRKPFVIVGVGAGPVSHPIARLLLARVVQRAEEVLVRDPESREFIMLISGRSDVDCAADAALASAVVAGHIKPLASRTRNKITLQISQQSASNEKWTLFLNRIETWLDRQEDAEVVIAGDQSGTKPSSRAIESSVHRFGRRPNVEVIPYQDIDQLLLLLSDSDLVITNKLHVGIAAIRMGRPVLAFSCHSKTERFYRQIGAPELCLPHTEWTSNSIDRLLDQGDLLIGKAFPIPEELVSSSKELQRVVGLLVHRCASELKTAG